MNIFRKFIVSMALLVSFFTFFVMSMAGSAQAQLATEDPKVTIDIATPNVAVRGEDLPIIITQNIIPKWHTYWENPGDSGEPMKVKWDLPEGVSAADLQFPVPERIPYGPLINFGYKGNVDFLTHLNIPENFERDVLDVSATIRWLVCEEICIPEKTELSFSLPVMDKQEIVDNVDMSNDAFSARLFALRGKLPQEVSWMSTFEVLRAETSQNDEMVILRVSVPAQDIDDLEAQEITLFPYDYGLITHAAPMRSAVERTQDAVNISLQFPRGDMPVDGFETFKALLVMGNTKSAGTSAVARMSAEDGTGLGNKESLGKAENLGAGYIIQATPMAVQSLPPHETFVPVTPIDDADNATMSDPFNAPNAQDMQDMQDGSGAVDFEQGEQGSDVAPVANRAQQDIAPVNTTEEDATLKDATSVDGAPVDGKPVSGGRATDNPSATTQTGSTTTYDPTKPKFQGLERWIFAAMQAITPAGMDPFFVTFMLFAFLGGVILNLMPCVFPVLSLKALSVVKLADYSVMRLWANGLFYTLGILVSFAVIAGALLLLRHGGYNIGWGFQLQNPTIIIMLSWLIFAVGLNLSGMYNISLGRLENAGGSLASQPGIGGAFFTGMLATLVATPCTAAFMGTALGAAVVLPTAQAMSIFLMLGFGLAFPYLLICLIPPLVRLLPRPGAWMETFRQFLAFPMYATAILLVWVAVRQVGDVGLIFALGGMLVLGFGVWLLGKSKDELGDRRPILTAIAVLTILAPLMGLLLLDKPKSVETNIQLGQHDETLTTVTQGVNYVSFDEAELKRLLVETERPVFVNMTASWCVTCLLNEQTSLNRDAVRQWMADHDVVYMKGDWTNYDDHITEYLAQFGRNGVPIYVFYGAPMDNGQRPDPIVLPQILTPSTVTDLIQ